METSAGLESLSGDFIELREAWAVIWRGRWWIVLASALGLLAAAVFVQLYPRIYRAEVVLMPVEATASGPLGDLGNLGPLASLAGVNLGGAESQTVETTALLTSRHFTLDFIRRRNLMPTLFAPKWDPANNTWLVSGDRIPTDGDAFKVFDQRVRGLTQDKKTSLLTLTVEWRDPALAADWANGLVADVNEEMRRRAITEADATIDLLQRQITQTQVVQLREALYKTLESEVKRKTFAMVREEYALRVIDPAAPAAAKEYVFPRRTPFLLGGLLAGGFAAALALLVIRLWRRAPAAG
jgi:uncharacterized protein involved in exopolysaccharide biosynthesis